MEVMRGRSTTSCRISRERERDDGWYDALCAMRLMGRMQVGRFVIYLCTCTATGVFLVQDEKSCSFIHVAIARDRQVPTLTDHSDQHRNS